MELCLEWTVSNRMMLTFSCSIFVSVCSRPGGEYICVHISARSPTGLERSVDPGRCSVLPDEAC
jgi:hypothetical protein